MYKLLALVCTMTTASMANPNPTTASVDELRQMVVELQSEVAQLKNQDNQWLNEQRSDQVRSLIHDVLADADTRSSLQGTGANAGYNKGAFLQSSDGNWKLKINGQLQSRWLYNDANGLDSQHGFEQRRTKIKFSGHIGDPSWVYKIALTWSRVGGSNTEDAWAGKKFDDGSWFKFGQFKQNFLRENIISSSKKLTVESSMLNNAFKYGWSQGIEYGWKNDDIKIIVQYTDGPGQSNTAALSAPTNAWVARTEFRFGEAGWKDFDYLTSKSGAKSGWLIGVAYENYDNDGGTFEYGNADANESNGWTVDVSYRSDGWNVFGYMVETTGKNTANADEVDSSGWLLQGGFLANDNVELFAQYQEGEVSGSNMDMDAIRIGFNYWPTAGSNNIKWSTDVAWAGKTITNGGAGTPSADWISSGNGWRADTGSEKDQMLLRTQLQILF
jgi:hypothetical protein